MGDKGILSSFNIKKRCRAAGVGLWQCPHFLFIIMGLVIMVAILATNVVARTYAESEVAALIVLGVAAFLFIVGNTIVRSFENIVEASRLKSEFVSIVSHELRSPLSAVKWSLDLLRSTDSLAGITAESESIVSSISEQNERMIRVVNNLLEVRRVEEKNIDLSPEKVFLEELTEKIIKDTDAYARASNIQVRLEVKANPAVFVDRQKIGFVISSLLENALRYSPGGSSVKVEIFEKSDSAIWRITDQGPGIPNEDRKKIFEKFFRSHNIYRYRSGGLGIGLFLSKALIEASGGKINFSSEDSRGSVFWFTLPKITNQ